MKCNGPHLLQCLSSTGRRPAHPEKQCASPQESLYQAEQSAAFRGNKAQYLSLSPSLGVHEFMFPWSFYPTVRMTWSSSKGHTTTSVSSPCPPCGCQLGNKKEKSLGHFQNDFHCCISAFGRMQPGTCQERKEIKDPRVKA